MTLEMQSEPETPTTGTCPCGKAGDDELLGACSIGHALAALDDEVADKEPGRPRAVALGVGNEGNLWPPVCVYCWRENELVLIQQAWNDVRERDEHGGGGDDDAGISIGFGDHDSESHTIELAIPVCGPCHRRERQSIISLVLTLVTRFTGMAPLRNYFAKAPGSTAPPAKPNQDVWIGPWALGGGGREHEFYIAFSDIRFAELFARLNGRDTERLSDRNLPAKYGGPGLRGA